VTPEEKQKLVAQIAAEAEQLANVPKIPLAKFMGGPVQRCHICSRLKPVTELQPMKNAHGRLGCEDCRRND
jgi:hypothetical protein